MKKENRTLKEVLRERVALQEEIKNLLEQRARLIKEIEDKKI